MQPALEKPPAAWMRAAATVTLLAALEAEGAEVRFVGGCVRDWLAGREVGDLDLATTAAPEDNMRLLAAAGLKAVPTGIRHGTVTAIVRGQPYEVTTLRRDVETYGRHARVAYTDDWSADARRRDFTMNALYADARGRIYDPCGGLADLEHGRVRFVGRPAARIAEDRLRILRFFRFHAWYGRGAANRAALTACWHAAPEIALLSGERIRNELLRLLAAAEPRPALRLMLRYGVLRHLLPDGADVKPLSRLLRAEAAERADPLRRLAALMQGSGRAAALAVAERFRLSNADRDRLVLMVERAHEIGHRIDRQCVRRAVYAYGSELVADLALLAGAPRQARLARAVSLPHFPLKGRDALRLGLAAGPEVGQLLDKVERWWIRADFRPDRQTCLARLDSLARQRARGGLSSRS
jgi:poly(A) polymerase